MDYRSAAVIPVITGSLRLVHYTPFVPCPAHLPVLHRLYTLRVLRFFTTVPGYIPHFARLVLYGSPPHRVSARCTPFARSCTYPYYVLWLHRSCTRFVTTVVLVTHKFGYIRYWFAFTGSVLRTVRHRSHTFTFTVLPVAAVTLPTLHLLPTPATVRFGSAV